MLLPWLRKLLESFNELKEAYKNLETILDERVRERDDFKKQAADLTLQVQEVTGTFEAVKAENTKLKTDLSQKNDRVSETSNEFEAHDYETRLSECNTSIDNYKIKVSELEGELRDITSKYANIQKSYDVLLESHEKFKNICDISLNYHDMYEKSVKTNLELADKFENAREKWRIEKDDIVQRYQDDLKTLGYEYSQQLIELVRDCIKNSKGTGELVSTRIIERIGTNEIESQMSSSNAIKISELDVNSEKSLKIDVISSVMDSSELIEHFDGEGDNGENTEICGTDEDSEISDGEISEPALVPDAVAYGNRKNLAVETNVEILSDNFSEESSETTHSSVIGDFPDEFVENVETVSEKLAREMRELTERSNQLLSRHVSTLDIINNPNAVHVPKYAPVEISEFPKINQDNILHPADATATEGTSDEIHDLTPMNEDDSNIESDYNDESVSDKGNTGVLKATSFPSVNNDVIAVPPNIKLDKAPELPSMPGMNKIPIQKSSQSTNDFDIILDDIVNSTHTSNQLNSDEKIPAQPFFNLNADKSKQQELENMELPEFDGAQPPVPNSTQKSAPPPPSIKQQPVPLVLAAPGEDNFDALLGSIMGMEPGQTKIIPKATLGSENVLKSMLGGVPLNPTITPLNSSANNSVVSIDLGDNL